MLSRSTLGYSTSIVRDRFILVNDVGDTQANYYELYRNFHKIHNLENIDFIWMHFTINVHEGVVIHFPIEMFFCMHYSMPRTNTENNILYTLKKDKHGPRDIYITESTITMVF